MKKVISYLFPFELIAIFFILISSCLGIFCHIYILPFRPWSFGHLFKWLLLSFVAFLILFVLKIINDFILTKSIHLAAKNSLKFFLKNTKFFLLLRFLISTEVVFTLYTTIKQAIPYINCIRYDYQLCYLDTILHFGINPSLYLVRSSTLNTVNSFLDNCYELWFYLKAIIIIYFIYFSNNSKSQLFLASYIALWPIGVIFGLIFPSSGPFVIFPGMFPANGMFTSLTTQTILKTLFDGAKSITLEGNGNLIFGAGLMAMPSLHVSACILYTIFFWKENKVLKSFSLCYLCLIFITSLLSGWHYAVDGYAGIVIASLSILVAFLSSNFLSKLKGSSGLCVSSAVRS